MSIRTVSAVSFLSVLGWVAPGAIAQAPRITVLLYNHAGAPLDQIEQAAAVAGGIFERAGLVSDWAVCPKPAGSAAGPSCDEFGKSVIRINLLDREKAQRLDTVPEAFGVAFTARSGFGVVAAVFHHRVAELERDWSVDADVVLGHILAHEIGHLLLGFQSHTSSGIMTAHWDEAELVDVERNAFGFYPGQAKKMRRQVQQRNAEDASSDTADVAADGNA